MYMCRIAYLRAFYNEDHEEFNTMNDTNMRQCNIKTGDLVIFVNETIFRLQLYMKRYQKYNVRLVCSHSNSDSELDKSHAMYIVHVLVAGQQNYIFLLKMRVIVTRFTIG